MVSAVRSYTEVAAVLRDAAVSVEADYQPKFAATLREAAALLAGVAAALDDCPTCGGEGVWPAGGDFDDVQYVPCPDCVDGKVTVEQLTATFARVWKFAGEERHYGGEFGEGWRACIDHLRSVRP